jgi:hypothetical protein
MWIVEATGEDTGKIFTYQVNAPETTSEMTVACSAYAAHGSLYNQGKVPELLGPEHVTYWKEVVRSWVKD